MNFDWFMERLESFLAVERAARWCGVGVVDITGFKWYNDTLGHSVGDVIIQRVARDSGANRFGPRICWPRTTTCRSRDLHARFGGDEFCFLIPDLREQRRGDVDRRSLQVCRGKLQMGAARTSGCGIVPCRWMSASSASDSAPSRNVAAPPVNCLAI